MSKFIIGQTVICIDDSNSGVNKYGLYKGDRYDVIKIYDNGNMRLLKKGLRAAFGNEVTWDTIRFIGVSLINDKLSTLLKESNG